MKTNSFVFFVSAGVILAFVGLGATFPGPAELVFSSFQDYIVASFGWFYILAVTFFLLFAFWLLVGPFGNVRLGKDEDRPNYTNLTWFAMLFSAGMGIGLLFFSVAEPVLHFGRPPIGGQGGTIEAAHEAMNLTFLHWGFHAWAIYIVVGLPLAYFAYRYDLPLSIRSTLYPVLGDRINGRIGDIVDVVAVFGTMFGIATSLGLGAMQINSGLNFLGILEVSTNNQVLLIGGVTAAATLTVATGLNRGVLRLSQVNILLGVLLVLFVLVAGPTFFLFSSFVESLGNYLQELPSLTFRTDAFQGVDWQKQWTMFYWGWWISWSPFVGMFIARISRGRTIREFVAGTLLVPTALTFIWLVAFGNTAIYFELFGNGGVAAAANSDIATALFTLLEKLPGSVIVISVATLVIATFFVTSANSGALVIDQLTAATGFDSPPLQKMFWALLEGAVAIALLLGGGLLALQTAAITTALPFCVIMLIMCRSLFRALRAEAVRDPTRVVGDILGEVHEPASDGAARPVRGGVLHRLLNWLGLRRGRTPGTTISRPFRSMWHRIFG